MSNLIDEIRAAREELRRQETETSEAGYTLSMCKQRQNKARKELDKLLDELETGVSRYPLLGFDRLVLGAEPAAGNGQASKDPVVAKYEKAVAALEKTCERYEATADAPKPKRKGAPK